MKIFVPPIFLVCLVFLSGGAVSNEPDPNQNQNHSQTPQPQGLYKYGYQTGQIGNGNINGYYLFSDDKSRLQYTHYLGGTEGYKVLTPTQGSIYTPEVAAARKAHEEAYLATRIRDLEALKASRNEQTELDMIQYNHAPLQSTLPAAVQPVGDGNYEINLFSGVPVRKPESEFPITSRLVSTNANSNQNFVSSPVDTKFYILPPPTVHHYEKIWPLPHLQYKDLSVQVDDTINLENRDLAFKLSNNFNRLYATMKVPQHELQRQNLFSFTQYQTDMRNVASLALKRAFETLINKYAN